VIKSNESAFGCALKSISLLKSKPDSRDEGAARILKVQEARRPQARPARQLIMKNFANSTKSSRRRIIAYWVTTMIIAAEFAAGGVMDILRFAAPGTVLMNPEVNVPFFLL
jgi:hypothetical protein